MARDLVMSISLNALEHLGINLYSNIPAVLSEIVANAWDADAKTVSITIDRDAGKIEIIDDGLGMHRDAVIDRFLTVGFRRRDALGEQTPSGRYPMGRKGIGKLSIFSIATKAEIYTSDGSERTAFRMDREVIRAAISAKTDDSYRPEEISFWPDDLGIGTKIVLSDLANSLTGMTINGLKRRVSRRFSIIGNKNNFKVTVNGAEITPSDRGYHNALEYMWTYSAEPEFVKSCKNLSRPAVDRVANIKDRLKEAGISMSGWIATVKSPGQLKDEDGDNLNRIAIFMRGKLAQEDVLDDFGMKEIFADYIIGEIHCDDLDTDDKQDMATSSRQSLKVDDERFRAMRQIIRDELRYIASQWTDMRNADGAKEARKVPAVSTWLDALRGDTKKKAEKWVGRLNTIRSQSDGDKKELLKASILAFESYRSKEELDKLDNISDESLPDILNIFESVDDLELSYYGQIVKLRIKVISTLQKKLKEDQKEKVIQSYIFDHLWLLDPSWERAKGTDHIEGTVSTFLKENSEKLSHDEKAGRIDIGYRTVSGKHVIIELKRSSLAVPVDDLVKQVRKYRSGAKKIFEETGKGNWPIEIICLVGKHPPEWKNGPTGQQDVIDSLRAVDARLVLYDDLIVQAQEAYADYLEQHVKVDKLWGVFAAIDDFAP